MFLDYFILHGCENLRFSFDAIKNSGGLSIDSLFHIRLPGLKKLMNRAFVGFYQLVL